jgi:hypothetical protein
VGHVLIDIEGAGGVDFQALAPNNAVQVNPGPGPDAAPQIELVGHWVYLVGNKPSVVSDIAAGGSDTTKLVAHFIDPTSGNNGRVRFILVEGQGAWVRRLDATDSHALSKEMTYIDAWRAITGSLDHIDDAEDFDRDTTPGSEGIMDDVDAARQEHGVP